MGSPQIVQAFSVNCTRKPCKSNLQVKPCILEITGILRNYYILFLKKLHGMSLYLQTLYKFRVCTCKVPVIPCKGLQCGLCLKVRPQQLAVLMELVRGFPANKVAQVIDSTYICLEKIALVGILTLNHMLVITRPLTP